MAFYGRDCDLDGNAKGYVKSVFDGDILLSNELLVRLSCPLPLQQYALICGEKETALDYTFHHLSPLSRSLAQGALPPITMTERLASPLYSRSMTSELLFEAYRAPSVTYGVDSLFAFEGIQARRKGSLLPLSAAAAGKKKGGAFKESAGKGESGLVINMGHMSTTLVPVLDGTAQMNRAKRCVVLFFLPFACADRGVGSHGVGTKRAS